MMILIVIIIFTHFKDPLMSPWTENEDFLIDFNHKLMKLNGDLVLNSFNNWLEMNRISFDEFDHAFGVTAYACL